ncbi:retrotransposon-related protein, partial [Tanacetum coccineum]
MVTEKTTSIPTLPTIKAQVTNVSESDLSSKFEQRLSKLEKKVEVMPKRAWTKKDQKQTNEMGIMRTKTELTLEYTQQGAGNEVLFYAGFSFLSEFETRWWSIKLQFFWDRPALLLSIHPDADAADALSRLSANVELHSILMSSIEPELLNKIKASWVADVDVKLLIQKLENQTVPNKKFTLKNGELRRKGKLVIGNNDTLRSQLIKVFHNEPLGGHSCILVSLKKAVLTILLEGYVQGSKDVCQIPEQVSKDISMDFINGLPRSQGNTVILVIVDKLSKYAHFVPLSHPYTTTQVAHAFLDNVYKLHGLPQTIASTFHIPYVLGTSNVDKVDRTLAAREEAINVLKFHLRRAQDRMKAIVDGHKTDRQYDVGDGLL